MSIVIFDTLYYVKKIVCISVAHRNIIVLVLPCFALQYCFYI